MKENVLDVLVYLFENYMADEAGQDHDQETLKVELLQAGFDHGEITKAFQWLEGLAAMQDSKSSEVSHTSHSMRLFTPEEAEKLDRECRGLLLFLEQVGVLDHHS
ncbi:MAG: DUF494 domain-containing protein, partial [Gammaproteobacteria bacterium]|nr:DUF494 domain-containing protein [Gammaproteobacteria bacterium]NIR97526.1 DUF494 domain-containing protein [Gammaproteobacteria bacterium]NIT63162.1 DUF494 domain-containing protein [Gammaproteobacteria bacterium]NIV20111.1 DUF494 family protein [Gammaproteobacteria bacterium]NIX10359.1 DUF494 family protein [Gammaproteobacteria bacterium]